MFREVRTREKNLVLIQDEERRRREEQERLESIRNVETNITMDQAKAFWENMFRNMAEES